MIFSNLSASMDRRNFMRSLGTAGVGAAALSACAQAETKEEAKTHKAFDPMNPEHNVEAFVKLNSDKRDGQEAYGWFGGRVFAVIGDNKTIFPLFDVEGFNCNRTTKQADGSYQNLQREVGYYKDLRTGEIIEEWKNPMLDDELVKVYQIHNDPVNSTYAPVFRQKFGDGQETSFPFLLPWTFVGENAMCGFDVNTQWDNILKPEDWPRESTGPKVRVSEYLQMHMLKEDLENPDLNRIPFTGAWQRIASWLPWMLMGGMEGHLFYRSHVTHVDKLTDIPKHLLDYTEKNYSKFLSAPTKFVEPNVTSFEVYANEATPAPVKE